MSQRHYNINHLNIIFACASLFLLSAIGLMFLKDYSREWKTYQKEFRALEIEKTRVKLELTEEDLQNDADYQAVLAELEAAKKQYDTHCLEQTEQDQAVVDAQAKKDIIDQDFKIAKSERDAFKYKLETSRHHQDESMADLEATFAQMSATVAGLQLSLQEASIQLQLAQDQADACGREYEELVRKERKLAMQRDVLVRKLEKIDPHKMSIVNQVANVVRDLPILDLANPNFKVQQVVLKDIREDVNFMTVPKVERCTTCHLGISNPDYAEAAQPFRTHPNLELFVHKDSPHSLEEFGCTSCHSGRARGTDFVSAAHTPANHHQQEEWEEKYGWEELHLWEHPMYAKPYMEAGCFKCHSGESNIRGAEKLNLGLDLIERAGCYNCHVIDKYETWPKSGPDLTQIASKLTRDFAYKWIEDPHSFRPDTWMPAYFQLSNNNDPESLERGEHEIHAMVEYLFESSSELENQPLPVKGRIQNGEELVASVGCLACHQLESADPAALTDQHLLRRQHGPSLLSLGSKVSIQWLYQWLKNPQRYHPGTRMPDLRLSDQEAADIATYLHQNQDVGFDKLAVPAIDEMVLKSVVMGFMERMHPRKEAEAKLATMSQQEQLVFAGEKLIGQYGCYSCHNIKGFEDRKPIGIELTHEGDKSLHKFDFGHTDVHHTKADWFTAKLKNPRIFDTGKELKAHEKSMMPHFYLKDHEVEAMVTALLGFVNQKTVEDKIVPRTPKQLYIEKGQELVAQMNCQGCHMMEGQGGTVHDTVKDWLVKFDDRSESEAEALVNSFGPPNLIGEGKKVNPDWLFNFLHSPSPIRPWLEMRMPTYSFNASHLNALVKYFNALDGEEFPFTEIVDMSMTDEEFKSAEMLFSKDYFGCAQCHIVGDQMPAGSPDSWAPNFALSKSRLKPEWLIEWLKNPQSLLPGTKMPTYFDPSYYENSGPDDLFGGDEDTQIRMLRNYLMTLSEEKKSSPKPPAAVNPPTDQMSQPNQMQDRDREDSSAATSLLRDEPQTSTEMPDPQASLSRYEQWKYFSGLSHKQK